MMSVLMIGSVIMMTMIWQLIKHMSKETNELTDNEVTVPKQTVSKHSAAKPGHKRKSSKHFYIGEIVFYDELKCFGFIRQQYSKGGRIFFHKSDVTGTKNIWLGLRVKYNLVDTQRGVKAIRVKLTSDNECVKSKWQQEVRLYGLGCIRITDDDGCVSLQDFKLSLHLYESYMDGEVEMNEIYEHISCRCQPNDMARSFVPR